MRTSAVDGDRGRRRAWHGHGEVSCRGVWSGMGWWWVEDRTSASKGEGAGWSSGSWWPGTRSVEGARLMGRVLRPGPASMEGLRWLARVGPAPLEAWRCAMVWSEVAARRHARRLEDAGWMARYPMTRGSGCLLVATREGIRSAGFTFRATGTPAPTFWAHHSARAWTATWLGLLGHEFLGDRELAHDPDWIEEVMWQRLQGLSPRSAPARPRRAHERRPAHPDRGRADPAIGQAAPANLDMYSRWRFDRGTDWRPLRLA